MKLLSLLGAALLLSIAASCVLAANHKQARTLPPLVSSPPMPTVSEPETDVTDSPAPATTTADPVKEEKILRELAGGRPVEEVRRVQKLLQKSLARQARKLSERKARRSHKERAEDDEKYAELKKWEETRRQLNTQRAQSQAQQGKQAIERHLSINEINRQAGLDSFLFQGDIRLSERQAMQVLDLDEADKEAAGAKGEDLEPTVDLPVSEPTVKRGWNDSVPAVSSRPLRTKRQVMNPVANSWNLWPVGDVYYAFDNSVNSTYRTLIRKAMDTWAAATCLAFYENNAQTYTMVFNAATSGCNAPIGLSQGVKNHTVSVNAPGCMQTGIIAHEIGHNVGMYHTMSRADRDDTVWVYEDNVDPAMLYNYNKAPASQQQSFGIPYDMGSLMHYDRKAFSGNGQQTMTWSGPTYEWDQTMGSQNMGPGMQDFKLINELYDCEQYCAGQNPIACYGGGFTKPWGTGMCSTCICPPGIGGAQCNYPVAPAIAGGYAPPGVTNTCNGTRLTATTSWQTLSGVVGSATRAGQTANDYANCHWWMQAPVGYHMVVEVTGINTNVFAQCTDGCFWGFTEVRMGNNNFDWSLPGRRMCCAADLGGQFGSSLTFTAPSSSGGREAMVSAYAAIDRQSFTLRYKAVAN